MTMIRCFPIAATFMFAAILSSSAMADSDRQDQVQRFSIIKTENGFLRLDQKNGNISICKADNDQMVCKIGADERHAYQIEIDRIGQQIDKMKVRLDALEGRKPTAKLKPGKNKEDEEFDRALKFADKAFRHFFGMVQELKKEKKKDAI